MALPASSHCCLARSILVFVKGSVSKKRTAGKDTRRSPLKAKSHISPFSYLHNTFFELITAGSEDKGRMREITELAIKLLCNYWRYAKKKCYGKVEGRSRSELPETADRLCRFSLVSLKILVGLNVVFLPHFSPGKLPP
jgi:hypothetical protein